MYLPCFVLVWYLLHKCFMQIKWSGPWENVSYVICEQQRRWSDCADAQSDQRSLISAFVVRCLDSIISLDYNISRFYSRNFKTLASFCGCAGRFESNLLGNSRTCRGSNASWWERLKLTFLRGMYHTFKSLPKNHLNYVIIEIKFIFVD